DRPDERRGRRVPRVRLVEALDVVLDHLVGDRELERAEIFARVHVRRDHEGSSWCESRVCHRRVSAAGPAVSTRTAGRIPTIPVGAERAMPRVLVIHGAGMNMRGKVQVDVFGPMTLAEYDERIRGYAKELGIEVEIFHSNIEGEIVNRLYTAN